MTHPEILITERLGSREYEVRRLGRCACCGAAVTNEDGEACFGRPDEDMLGNVCCNATADRLGRDYRCGRAAVSNTDGEVCGCNATADKSGKDYRCGRAAVGDTDGEVYGCNATADRLDKDYCCGRVAAANINGREYCGGTLFCSDECFMKYYGYCRAEV